MREARAETGPVPAVSGWVERFAELVPKDVEVLDVACGAGRHGRFFRRRGNPVVMLDRNIAGATRLLASQATLTFCCTVKSS